MKAMIYVALRENAVLMVIEQLIKDNRPVNYEVIQTRLNCSRSTVHRAMSNLIKSKLVEREGTPGGGYIYRMCQQNERIG